jgi:NADH:ubiquinone oxidoreductase subunit C
LSIYKKNNKQEMATFKKTLETWYKETYPDKNLIEGLKNLNNANIIFLVYLLDDNAVEYTTEYEKAVYVYAFEHYKNPRKIDITVQCMNRERLDISSTFIYSIAKIDLVEIQRKLESTVIHNCNKLI